MSRAHRTRLTVAALVVLAGSFLAFRITTAANPARFTYDRAPGKVVLFLFSPSSQDDFDAMMVHGDGRVLLYSSREQQPPERLGLMLDSKGVEGLLQLAIDHGLAEYDSDDLWEAYFQKSAPAPPFDGPLPTTAILALESFTRSQGDVKNLEKFIRFDNVEATAARYPTISPIQGLAKLRQQMHELIAQARAPGAKPPAEPDFESARFTISRDPKDIVLSITSTGGLRHGSTSIAVYGDGRVALAAGSSLAPENASLLVLDHEEVEALISEAVHHGLLEYDSVSIRARQLLRKRGRPYGAPADAGRTTLVVRLESYSRSSHTSRGVEKEVTMEAPDLAAIGFPEIQEARCIAKLQAFMFNLLREKKKSTRGEI
ncbi:MAG: hypothetical protein HC897_19550 [Thermoanaerobaculia bacterium]|nr:hypothetical protein [Thermoanaerobaculia bacterium]